MPLTQLTPRIWRLPSAEEPLSADVFIIEGDEQFYVFDVGSNDEALATLLRLDKPVTVILSHFHRDHTANMARLSPVQTLAGVRTLKHIPQGTLVDAPLTLRDGIGIVVCPCVSPHAPGCLIATVDGAYTLIGDLTYARDNGQQAEAKGMLNALRRVDTAYFVPSHMQGDPLVEKDALLRGVREYFHI